MAPLDPDSLIMRGRGFLESGMTSMSNILLKLMWLDECSKLTVLVTVTQSCVSRRKVFIVHVV